MYYEDKLASRDYYIANEDKINEWLRSIGMSKEEIKKLAEFLGMSYKVLELQLLLKGDKNG